ncbi:hypothetical protein WJX72_000082 [[Myrmecia] bisecta]|uniref:Tyrosine-protein kinase ephrin type A/B receptor-like domain-containing protein n=1 Tax=[Myrmecia] bisecta TaxID=41462 RepID=A0AAW1Q699_9CHLO
MPQPPIRPGGLGMGMRLSGPATVPWLLLLLLAATYNIGLCQNPLFSTDQDTTLAMMLALQADANNPPSYRDPIVIQAMCQPKLGTLAIDPGFTGAATYAPQGTKHGLDLFSYEITDSTPVTPQSALLLAQVDVNAVNHPPMQPADTTWSIAASLTAGTAYVGKLNPDPPYDSDNDLLTYSVVTQPTWATVTISGVNTVTVLPKPSAANVADNFVYKVTDCCPSANTNPAACSYGVAWNPSLYPKQACTPSTLVTVSFSIGAPQGLPNVIGNSAATALTFLEDIAFTGPINRDAVAGETNTSASNYLYQITRQPTKGTLQLLCAGADRCNGYPYGQFSYTPNANANGADDFGVTLADPTNPTATSTPADIHVYITPANDPPVAASSVVVVPMLLPPSGLFNAADYAPTSNTSLITVKAVDVDNAAYSSAANTAAIAFSIAANNYPTRGSLYRYTGAMGMGQPIATVLPDTAYLMYTPSATSDTYEIQLFYLPFPQSAGLAFRGLPLDAATITFTDMAGGAAAGISAPYSLPQTIMATLTFNVPCALGWSRDGASPGSISFCVPCPAGTFAGTLDQDMCEPCTAGSFTAVSGSSTCRRCPINSWQDRGGQSSCNSCPQNTDKSGTSVTDGDGKMQLSDCLCAGADPTKKPTVPGGRGYYGVAGQPCMPCPGPSTPGDPEWTLCPDPGMRWPRNNFGYFVHIPPNATAATLATASACDPPFACPGRLTLQQMRDQPCESGYGGERCSVCAKNPSFYRYQGTCRRCPKGRPVWFVIGFGILAVLFIPILFKINGFISKIPSLTITLNFAQILAIFPAYHIRWPPVFRRILELFSVFNFNFELVHPECSVAWSWRKKFLISLEIPLGIVGLLSAAIIVKLAHHALARCLGPPLKRCFPTVLCAANTLGCSFYRPCNTCRAAGHRPRAGVAGPPPAVKGLRALRGKLRYALGHFLTSPPPRDELIAFVRKAVMALLLFFKVAYVFLSRAVIEYLSCTKDTATGKYFLAADPSIQCYHRGVYLPDDTFNVWGSLLVVGVVALLAYPVGIIAALGALLYKARGGLHSKPVMEMLGTVYFPYAEKWFFWEVVLMARKVLIVLFQVIFSNDTVGNGLRQSISGMIVLLLSLMGQMYAYPFANLYCNHLEAATIGAQFFGLYVGTVLLSPKNSRGFSFLLEGVACVASVVALIACLIFIAIDTEPLVAEKLEGWRQQRRRQARVKAKAKAAQLSADRHKHTGGEESQPLQGPRHSSGRAGAQRTQQAQQALPSLGAVAKVHAFVRRAWLTRQLATFLTPTGARVTWELLRRQDEHLPSKAEIGACFQAMAQAITEKDDLRLSAPRPPHLSMVKHLRARTRTAVLEGLSRGDRATACEVRDVLETILAEQKQTTRQRRRQDALWRRCLPNLSWRRSNQL